MGLKTERVYPYVGGVIAGVLGWWKAFDFPVAGGESKANEILTNGITLGSILIGFLTAALTLLPALDSTLMRKIKKTSYYRLLISYLMEGIWIPFVFVSLSFTGYWFSAHRWYPPVWLGMAAVAALAFYRATRISMSIAFEADAARDGVD